MKKQHFGILIAAAAVLAGGWFARLAWRAHQGVVTLDMRNAPLADVVRAMERQTWEKIEVDSKLNPRITIKVKDAPLSRVLDLVAGKAGARWQKTFAVYGSSGALAKLEPVLRGDEKLANAGWTNLAPDISETALPPADGPGEGGGGASGRGLPSGGRGGNGMRRMLSGPPGGTGPTRNRMITISPDGKVDRWSSERLVLESQLAPGLLGAIPSEATPETAARTASTVHGRSAVYYALAPSPFGMAGPRRGRIMRKGSGPGNIGDAAAHITQERREARLRELANSPEEQAQQARQNAGSRMQIQTTDEEQKQTINEHP